MSEHACSASASEQGAAFCSGCGRSLDGGKRSWPRVAAISSAVWVASLLLMVLPLAPPDASPAPQPLPRAVIPTSELDAGGTTASPPAIPPAVGPLDSGPVSFAPAPDSDPPVEGAQAPPRGPDAAQSQDAGADASSVDANPVDTSHVDASPVDAAPPAPAAEYQVIGTAADEAAPWLVLRSRPHFKKGRILAKMPDGTPLEMKSGRHGRNGAWRRVRIMAGPSAGTEGYGHARWIGRRDGANATVWRARLSHADHHNSGGKRLSAALDVVVQDRANVHRFGRVDPEDEVDERFTDRAARRELRSLLMNKIDAATSRRIVRGSPLVEVRVAATGASVRVVED